MELAKFVKTRQEQFGAAVFDTLKEKVFVTNKSGGDIMNLIKEGKTSTEITAILSENFDASTEEINIGVTEFIQELKKNSLVE